MDLLAYELAGLSGRRLSFGPRAIGAFLGLFLGHGSPGLSCGWVFLLLDCAQECGEIVGVFFLVGEGQHVPFLGVRMLGKFRG